MNLTTAEAALADWIQAVTGLASERVYFTAQGQRPPANITNNGNRVSITLGDIPTLGQSETLRTFNPLGPRGKEITQERISMATVTVTFQVYGQAVVGVVGPRQLALDLRASIELDSYRAALRAAGLGPNVSGTVRWVPAIAGANFEARAVFEVLFSCSVSALEQLGYVQTALVRGTVNGAAVAPVALQLTDDVRAYLGAVPLGRSTGPVLPAPTVSIAVLV